MNQHRDLLKWQWLFFLAFFMINFVGLLVIAYYGKDQLHLYFNQHFHHKFFDLFFRYYTDIATTYVFLGIVAFIIFKRKWRDLIYLLSVTILSSLFATIIKRFYFVHGHRPTHYFKLKNLDLRVIEGVESQIPYTFPSGHTVLAIVLSFYLCMLTKNRVIQLFICIMMGLVAIGRVYLSKHFVIDTIGGSMLGLFFAILGYYFIWNSTNEKLDQKIWKKKQKTV